MHRHHDWRGTLISEGSTIVYPVRQGSSMWMVEATVLFVHSETLTVQPTKRSWPMDWDIPTKWFAISRWDRVTVVG